MNRLPVEKNKDYKIKITGMGYSGEGVGKIDEFTIFVPGAIKNEYVEIKIVKVNKRFAFGKLIKIIEPSEFREKPICPIYNRCGGCQIQHMKYEEQLDFKTKRVEDSIRRIGTLDIKVNKTMGMKDPYRYRNKVQLPIGKENTEIVIGFYAKKSHKIINIEECFIQDKISDKVLEITKQWIKKYKISIYNEENHSGILRHLMIRKAFKTGQLMIVLVTNGQKLPFKNEFVNTIKDNIKEVKSIIHNINSKKTNVILGDDCFTLWGKDFITDYIGKFKFNISPLSFFQVNPMQTEILYNKVLEFADLKGEETVFDAYCGTGTISLFLSQNAKKVYGVEIVAEAIENAIINAEENNIKNAEFFVGKAENVIPELISKGIYADVVVVDPPRKGCETSLLEAIATMKPNKIVYVSCDPGTLARDLKILNELNYKTIKVQPVDMFPQTSHVETVVLISHKKS
ncbi:23S rRNA (uracil(1939)-C(5))-methyltransferase RlmD [Clostridium rectalis]|uniref:23S rRNA (uracil(1939)-C(5))-methyltransferase RlmD n=1 Tax=Clostridium rectalis TaxID=2040295 RepID=UPI000F636944|nr:23S rRNA (uracil(1939)-C(5))-methyltransferase RlmD [Clostridium rectalis]